MMKNNFPNNDFKLKHEIESKLRALAMCGSDVIGASKVMNFTAEYVAEGQEHIKTCNALHARFERGEHTPELLAAINLAGERMGRFMDSLAETDRAQREEAKKAASNTHNVVAGGMAETLKKMRAMKGLTESEPVAAAKKSAIVFEDRSLEGSVAAFDPAHMN